MISVIASIGHTTISISPLTEASNERNATSSLHVFPSDGLELITPSSKEPPGKLYWTKHSRLAI